jgi:hypothetical protein
MIKLIRIVISALVLPFVFAYTTGPTLPKKLPNAKAVVKNTAFTNSYDCYAAWNLTTTGLSKLAFDNAMKGYQHLLQKNKLQNANIITIVDYSLPSTQKRLFVLDITNGKVLYNTLAAHGRNSGKLYANNFSNQVSSLKTSLGFFVTGNTYVGTNGYSLKLNGCEKGINDKALERAIVIHGANYVHEDFIQQYGYLGRSHGCPALPQNISKNLINQIKNGSCVFLYHPAKKYATYSKILNS